MRITRLVGSIAVLSTAAVLTACCSSGTAGSPSTPAAASGQVTLEFWCWGTTQKSKVEAFNKSHPDIQVKHTDVGGGTDTAAKLLTATRAGTAPTPPASSTTLCLP